jgi:hypothetical protein
MIYFGKKWGHFDKKYGRNDFRQYYRRVFERLQVVILFHSLSDFLHFTG